jgi:hypothetical protein
LHTKDQRERSEKDRERKERKDLAKPFSNTIVLFQNYFGWLVLIQIRKGVEGLL